MSEKSEKKFWETDAYLKQNAAGAHSKAITVLGEISEMKKELSDLSDKVEKLGYAIVLGIILLLAARFFKNQT